MAKRLEDQILNLTIYLLPLQAFSFFSAGYGLIQPGLISLLILLSLLLAQYGINTTKALGSKNSIVYILVFFLISVFATLLGFFSGNFYSYTKSLGVLGSLIIFFGTYYTVSYVNKDFFSSTKFAKKFFDVSVLVACSVILEWAIKLLTGNNYFFILIKLITNNLPYEHPIFADDSIDGRYKGILVEPGDVGFFTIPAFVFATVNLLGETQKTNKTRKTIFLVVIVLANLLTKSTANLTLLLFLSLFLLFQLRQLKSKLFNKLNIIKIVFKIIIPSLFMAALVIVFAVSFQDLLDPVIRDRVVSLTSFAETGNYDNSTNLSVQTILNGYNAALYALKNNLLFGMGLGNVAIAYDAVTLFKKLDVRLNYHDAFSMLLRLLIEVGVAGTISFVSIFVVRIFQSQKTIFITDKLINNKLVPKSYSSLMNIGRATNVAAISSLLFALLNRPSFWNLIIPFLFGICFKKNFINYRRNKLNNTLTVLTKLS